MELGRLGLTTRRESRRTARKNFERFFFSRRYFFFLHAPLFVFFLFFPSPLCLVRVGSGDVVRVALHKTAQLPSLVLSTGKRVLGIIRDHVIPNFGCWVHCTFLTCGLNMPRLGFCCVGFVLDRSAGSRGWHWESPARMYPPGIPGLSGSGRRRC